MALQELILDYDYYENEQCNFSDLKEATMTLTSATQDQFEEIKKEKWFNRVFNMVTFSKNREKRMANQIGNLAQAQQVILEILVRLSDRDTRISDFITEAFDKIEKLSHNDVLLAERINLLEERYVLGISKETDIGDLSDIEREVLGGLFLHLMHQFNQVSEDQQRYVNNVLNYLEAGTPSIDIQTALASINQIHVKKKLLTCCLEYCFLNDYSFHLPDGVVEIIDAFDFGSKTIWEVKNKIETLYSLRGADGLIDKYGRYNEFDETFNVDMPELDFEEEAPILREVNIRRILHIPHGEEKVFKNNIVHISTYINCEGRLEFDNCVVYYNEFNVSHEITLSEGASIQFKNCQVFCCGIDPRSFIQCEGHNQIELLNCELNDCSHFIGIKSDSNFTINNCVIHTPGEHFLNSEWGDQIKGKISNTKIDFLKNQEEETEQRSQNNVQNGFSIFQKDIVHIDGSVEIYNCEISGTETIKQEGFNDVIFNISEATYHNCSFKNVNTCISQGIGIHECSFESCTNVIKTSSRFNIDKDLEIINCLFKNCENITTGDHILIKNSQFVDCRNGIVNGEGITVEFCEFYNLVHDLSGVAVDASFQFRCGKNSASNTISKCIFDGVAIGEGFLIQGNTFEKIPAPRVYVQDCDFRNCTTKRSSNVIVRQYNYYYGLFNKKVETKPVSIINCKGLDKVNHGKGYADEVIIRYKTPTGVKIGVAVAGAVAGWPGLVIGMGAAKLLRDDDLHQE